jgi:hypothetical protein
VHAIPEGFALCEHYTSQHANKSTAVLERVNPRYALADD